MFLKEIELTGFKSFADKTKLRFSKGVTAIVGPNGCGKSNIADAFRWVFGEQSAKSLRGSKMPDVIFAGNTTTRKALNFAEVTITFSDVKGALPTDYEEVAVTRRIHRSGESEYSINGHSVRLKDIQSLFLDSGMGKDAYSIFEQGKIDQIINYSPLERRYIFEEAAGILRFLHRKREALRKLEQADLNVCRLKDIVGEVEVQIGTLQKQAEEARTYQLNQNRLIELEKSLLLFRWENNQQRYKEIGNREKETYELVEKQKFKWEALKEELKTAKIDLEKHEIFYRQRNEEVFKTRSEKEIKSRERLSSQERIKEAIQKEKRWFHDLETLVMRREARQEEIKNLQKLQLSYQANISSSENILTTMREAFHKKEMEVSALQERQRIGQQDFFKKSQREQLLESELKQAKIRFESAEKQLRAAAEQQSKLQSREKEQQQSIYEKQKAFQELCQEGERERSELLAMEQLLQEIGQTLQKEQKGLDQLAKERTECRARQKMLLRLREEKEGFSSGTKKLLQEALKPSSPLYQKLQPLFEMIQIGDSNRTALATALRSYGQTLLVKNWGDFELVIAYAKEKMVKDFSLFCLEELEISPSDSSDMPAITSLEISQHFTSHLKICPERQIALSWMKNHPNFEAWLEEEALVDQRKVFFYYTPSESHPFVREAELKSLEAILCDLDVNYLLKESLCQNLQNEKAVKLNEKVEKDKSIRKGELRAVEANFALQRVTADHTKNILELEQIQNSLAILALSSEQLKSAIELAQQQHLEAKAALQELERARAGEERALEDQIVGMKREQLVLREKEAAFHKSSDENRKVLHALHVHEIKDLESRQQELRLEEELKNCRDVLNHLKITTNDQDQLIKEVEILLAQVTEATAHLEKEIGIKKNHREKIEENLQREAGQIKKGEDQLHQFALQLAQIEASQQAFCADLQERYDLNFEILKEKNTVSTKSIESGEKQIRALKSILEASGAVNMAAIHECAKAEERYKFLTLQLHDMDLSKKELIEIIASLDEQSRKMFQETFEKIRSNFKKNFALLFQGGDADLQFTETADLLEAGIEIIARPPSKQMRSIQLLSGGEKCLTAMALLFAVFEVKPSPFCILDEIDAPLDDANVERFVRVVQQFVESTQFLIITHNKSTMMAADILFGVSMEEKGVSTILAMEFALQPSPQLMI